MIYLNYLKNPVIASEQSERGNLMLSANLLEIATLRSQ